MMWARVASPAAVPSPTEAVRPKYAIRRSTLSKIGPIEVMRTRVEYTAKRLSTTYEKRGVRWGKGQVVGGW